MSEFDKSEKDSEATRAEAETNEPMQDAAPNGSFEPVSDRRRILKFGAAAVPAIATLSPSMAMATYGHGGRGWEPGGNPGGAAVSLMMCTVPMPNYVSEEGYPVEERDIFPHGGTKYHKNAKGDKKRVYRGPPGGSYSGQQIKDSFASGGWNPPAGVDEQEYQAHLGYLYRVRTRQVQGAGLTCLVSLTNNLNTFHG